MKKTLIALAVLAIAGAVYAQDLPKAGSFGITGSVGKAMTTLGAWYNATDKIAIRPVIGFSTFSNSDNYSNDPASTSYFSIGADVLYQLPIAGGFVLGVGPGLSYTSSSDKYDAATYTTTTTTGTFEILAKASAQYYFSKNFAAYLNAGLGLDFTSITVKYDPSSGSTISTTYDETSFYTYTAALGVAYFF